MVCGWSPPTGPGSCCDLQSLYLTREINYCWQMSRSKGEVGGGGCILTDMAALPARGHYVWPRDARRGGAPCLLSATPPWSSSLVSNLYPHLWFSFKPGCSRRSRARSCQAELACGFDHFFQVYQSGGFRLLHSLMHRTRPWLLLKFDYRSCCQFLCDVFSLFWLDFHCVWVFRWVAGRHRQPFPTTESKVYATLFGSAGK